MRIGLFGGTFNPVHNGHMALAKGALEKLNLEKIILIPSYIPPHKEARALASAEDRFRMLELAVDKGPGFEISRFEIDKEEKSYSIKTLVHFKQTYPKDTEFFFLIGADSLKGLNNWKHIDKILQLCRFAVCNRPDFFIDITYPQVDNFEIEPVHISSTDIRERIKKSQPVKGMVPEAVLDYIRENNLYR
jgi:nicotinate-nucleotide adenylyltransferase